MSEFEFCGIQQNCTKCSEKDNKECGSEFSKSKKDICHSPNGQYRITSIQRGVVEHIGGNNG